jgi:drug/metabolite transporter (DMT)-like permease
MRIQSRRGCVMQKSVRLGVAIAFACLLILGVMPVLANSRPSGSDGLAFAIWMTFWQLVAALPLFFYERATAPRLAVDVALPVSRRRMAAIALLTGAMFGVSTYMYIVAAEKAGAVGMGVALQAYPLFAMLLEAVFQGKRKTRAEIGFTLLMIVALAYLTTGGTMRLSGLSYWSVFALGIPLLWSIAHLMLKHILETMPVSPNQVTVSRLVISGVFLLLVHAALGETGLLVAALSDGAFQRAAIALGIAYYLELVLWFYAMRHIDVSLASSVMVPAPAVTMLIAVTIIGEAVATYQVVSMAVIAAALYGLLLAGRRG